MKSLQPLSCLARAESRIPKIRAFCFYCGQEFTTYAGLLLVPPDPSTIHRPHEGPISSVIEGVSTCRDIACVRKEIGRQDAILSVLIEPERQHYFAERDARIAAVRGPH